MNSEPIRFELKPEDRADEPLDGADTSQGQPVNADMISALTEAQILEITGKLGTIKAALLAAFGQQMSPAVRRPLRLAYSAAEEGIRLSQAVVGSTTRRS